MSLTLLQASKLRSLDEDDGLYRLRSYGNVDKTGSRDVTQVLNDCLAAWYKGGGGTVAFPRGDLLLSGQIVIPNGNQLSDGAYQQPALIWQGRGGYYNGQNQLPQPGQGTRLLLGFEDAVVYNNAQIVTYGLGHFALLDLILQDLTASSVTPLLYSTGTTIHAQRCAFLGPTKAAGAVQKDGIVLGGKTKPNPGTQGWGDPDAAFQGYGTVIENSYFNYLRRCVYGRSYCNQVSVRKNFFDKGTGTNLTGGDAACIVFDGFTDATGFQASNGDTANIVEGNYFEWTGGYFYQVLLRGCSSCVVANNGAEDLGANEVALVRCEGAVILGTTYKSSFNKVNDNFTHNGVPLSEDAISLGANTARGNQTTQDYIRNSILRIGGSLPVGLQLEDGAGGVRCVVEWGHGSPQGVVSAAKGSIWVALDGSVGTTFWVNETGTNTGWTAMSFGTVASKTVTSASYGPTTADAGTVVEMSRSLSGQTVTVPTQAAAGWVVGTILEFCQVDVGQTTFVGGTDGITTVVLQSPLGLKLAKQWSSAVLRYRGSDVWVVAGDTTP